MSRFDLLITLVSRGQSSEELGQLLVGEMGADPAAVDALLETGRIRLQIGVDFAYASWCARSLAGHGATVELVPASDARVFRPPDTEPSLRLDLPPPDPVGPSDGVPEELPPDFDPTPADNAAAATTSAEVARRRMSDTFAAAPREGAPRLTGRHPTLPPSPSSSGTQSRIRSTAPAMPATRNTNNGSARVQVRTCPRCGSLLAGAAECVRCAEGPPSVVSTPWARLSRLRAALRARPTIRLAVGFVLALGIGYVAQAPYSRRAENEIRRVDAEANRLRYRADPALRQRAAQLDRDVDAAAQGAAFRAAVIWLIVASAAFVAFWLFI